jgi:hypothetical protein
VKHLDLHLVAIFPEEDASAKDFMAYAASCDQSVHYPPDVVANAPVPD